MNIKDRGNEKPAGKNSICNKQKIHESNGLWECTFSWIYYQFLHMILLKFSRPANITKIRILL